MDYKMEENSERVSFITCAVWVPKGVAKSNPEKVEISKEDLARIIQETKGNIQELEEINEEDYEKIENVDDKGKDNKQDTAAGSSENKKTDDENKDFKSRYSLEGYDEEKDEDDKLDQLLQLGMLTVHSSNEDDPYVTIGDDEDNDSEDSNHQILPSDNLIAVGHVEGDAAILEVYVYNGEESSLYVHHDLLLPAVPLCIEWLNYDPGDEQLKPANMVAIGSMSPVVDVWDLDLVDCLEPAYTLGKRGKKKKKVAGVGHKDPVLSLAWNRHAEHVLASGSVDQTVILWDLQHGSMAQQITTFEEKVQSINWHHKEAHTLVSGSCDGKVRIFDCRSNDTCKTWKLDGEVECAVWETLTKAPYNCLASTDQGTVFLIDARQGKPLWTLNAHTEACTAVRMSPKCPGCMVTVSSDKSVKIWDIGSGKPCFIEEDSPKLGTIQCLASCPDLPFVYCMGGDNKENNFKVWDIRESRHVRSRFCSRVGLPVDEEELEMETEEGSQPDNPSPPVEQDEPQPTVSQASGAEPKPKFRKKKGGHLDRRKRKC